MPGGRGGPSARLRLALTWSLLVLAVGAAVVAGIFVAVDRSLDDEPVSQLVVTARRLGSLVIVEPQEVEAVNAFEQAVNERTRDLLRRSTLVAALALFPASLAIGWVLAGRVLSPVERVTELAREIAAGERGRRLELDGPDDEIRRLGDTFDEMLDRIDEGFHEQQAFVQNASHELRTPLAAAMTNLDVGLRGEEAELRGRAESARRILGRLADQIDEMLLYARHQAGVVKPERVDLAGLAASVVDDYAGVALERGVAVIRQGGSAEVNVEIEAMRRAIGNLVDNAVRLAPVGSEVVVRTGVGGAEALVEVSDQGPGLSVAEQEAVFGRFTGSRDGGTGLGLAIVRQTAEAHGGRVEVESSVGQGSVFRVRIPLVGRGEG